MGVMLEVKLKIVQELEKGKSQRVVLDFFGESNSTVEDIWKDWRKIWDALLPSESWST